MRDLDRYIQQVYSTVARQTDWGRSRAAALALLADACSASRALWITGLAEHPDATEVCWPPQARLSGAALAALTLPPGERSGRYSPLPGDLAGAASTEEEGVVVAYVHRGSDLQSRVLLCFEGGVPTDMASLKRAGGHLVEAGSLGLNLLLERDEWLTAFGRPARGPAALLDREGRYFARSPAFGNLLTEHLGGGAASARLPVAWSTLPARGSNLRLGPLVLRISPLERLWLVHARLPRPLDALSPREQQVARALCEGKTFKRIGQQMSLSASTVANHTASIYRKLGIFRREELLQLMRHSPPSPEPEWSPDES